MEPMTRLSKFTVDTPIDQIGLPKVGVNALKGEGIFSLWDASEFVRRECSMNALKRLPNFGNQSFAIIRSALNGLPAPTQKIHGIARPSSSICTFDIVDADMEVSHHVRHTQAGELLLFEYGEQKLSMDYEQARAVAWALISLCDAHE